MNRRRAGRWLRRRAPKTPVEQIAAGVIAVACLLWVLQAAASAGQWLVGAWPVLVVFLAAAAGASVLWRNRRAAARREHARRLAILRLSMGAIDAMDDQAFEFALRDLMLRDGCTWARRVGQAGDQCADVIAEHPFHGRIVVQAKHTTVAAKVGSHVMYQVNGTARPVHRADIAVVVTNGSLTRDAKAWGDRHGICWIDRALLHQWADTGRPLAELLRLPVTARKRQARRAAA
ncbi:restriction endonuclease [Streptomyces cocklensis]|uniref:Restriction system protein n=1 Tax=Actinacidiphila cocklensis TaxID=887465 RepID=A0A9W4EAR5_9ACTN|nr:restriction endonuclease [Actinacidiphila cocklensis]MDD1064133.1 restriction endonuclease [Actinacidiphila cocklensis]CAG6397578.1 Restriction system protein [Actinacidiphila cocklensis]